MKKRWIFTAVGAAAGGTLAYFMKDEDNRKRVTDKAKSFQANLTQDSEQGDMPIEEAGQPEASNPENSKMVSEGSQFGVQYYNELTEKEREILERSNS
ncbi:hypothetical protein [Halobacillus amylolyticus]|uniref:YtxH domain-containing protein n=1 Tax=Halobacillus amylolyticus TaxID=2932259 RepID=A0ABY4HE90_9BACI|nr:hypothetical protein [Halobacillus amylolyticus]UOR12964.1 hypothetical protein MUO15_05535 [Halobacillus amylolyticus]